MRLHDDITRLPALPAREAIGAREVEAFDMVGSRRAAATEMVRANGFKRLACGENKRRRQEFPFSPRRIEEPGAACALVDLQPRQLTAFWLREDVHREAEPAVLLVGRIVHAARAVPVPEHLPVDARIAGADDGNKVSIRLENVITIAVCRLADTGQAWVEVAERRRRVIPAELLGHGDPRIAPVCVRRAHGM